LSLLNVALTGLTGVLLLFPLPGVLIVGLFFLLSGVLRILLALRLRPLDQWGWLLTSGILVHSIRRILKPFLSSAYLRRHNGDKLFGQNR
jgi:uncharacterized membrane protein HdeD (DUF308 family)